MDERERRPIVLEVQPGEPINGHIHRPGKTPEPFHGWLELVTKLERIRGNQRDAPKTLDHRTTEDGRQPFSPHGSSA